VCSVTQAQPTDGQALGTPEVTESRFRLASVTVSALGALGLAFIAAWVLLTSLTRDLQICRDGAAVAAGLVCGLVGMLVARRQARNPEGWLLLGVAVGVFVVLDSGLYAVLGYRVHYGRLPLGEVAVIGKGSIGEPLIFCFALVILLFPDGRLTRGWTWVLWVYLVLSTSGSLLALDRRRTSHLARLELASRHDPELTTRIHVGRPLLAGRITGVLPDVARPGQRLAVEPRYRWPPDRTKS
jgi:hypothetical protein